MSVAGAIVSHETLVSQKQNWQEAWLESRDDPYKFAVEVMGFLPAGVPNPDGALQLERWQDTLLRQFFTGPDGNFTDSPRHSIRAGHGVGKGVLLSILALWFVATHYDSKCVLTANSQDQLRDNNWSELRKWHRHLPEPLRNQLEVHEERIMLKVEPEMAFVVRRTASRNNPEALQGIHAKYVLYLIDEASGIPDIVFEVAQGSLSTHGAMAVMTSNPTRGSGYFYDTHHRLRNRWKCWTVNCEDVPRASGHIQDVIDSYGRGSNKYRVRVQGEFPTADDDTVIPLAWVQGAIGRDVVELPYLPVWGLDVARYGDDSTALAKRQANRLLEPVKQWHNKDTMQVTGIVYSEFYATHEDMRPKEILVDVIGIGAGVVDRCRELGLPVRGINVGESFATDDHCMRLRDELWWKGREWFESKDCSIPDDQNLISELVVPTYDHHSSGRIVVESKKDLKKRGVKSPNCADALLLTFAGSAYRKAPLRKGPPIRNNPWAA